MKKLVATFLLILTGILMFPSFVIGANGRASESVNVSLSVEAYVKCTVQGDEMTIMTNSYNPVSISEDGKALSEKAVFGKLAKVKIKKGSIYTILAGI